MQRPQDPYTLLQIKYDYCLQQQLLIFFICWFNSYSFSRCWGIWSMTRTEALNYFHMISFINTLCPIKQVQKNHIYNPKNIRKQSITRKHDAASGISPQISGRVVGSGIDGNKLLGWVKEAHDILLVKVRPPSTGKKLVRLIVPRR